jgi:voltage-gated potassium channel
VVVVVVIVWQFRVILGSPYPTLQGVQALALSAPLFLLIYANVYYVLALSVAGSFTEPLTRTDSYFAFTVFATIGFGDIAPVSQDARVLVIGQLVGNLLVIGVALRVVLTAVQHSRQRSAEQWHHRVGG